MKNIIFVSILSFLLFSGCADIATKDDIDTVKEKVSSVEDDLYAAVKQISERFQNVENDYNQKIQNLNKDIKEISDKVLLLNNEIDSIKSEIKEIKGKIDEIKFEYDEKIKKLNEDFLEKNIEVRRDLEGLKKAYNDLITTSSVINKNLSTIQTDVINLKDSQTKILSGFQNIPDRINQIEEKLNLMDKKLEVATQNLLDEITRHESEIYYLKKSISEGKIEEGRRKETILKTEKGNYYVVQKGDYLSKIAKKFNTSISEIKKLNNLKSDVVYPGQKLLIP